MMQRASEGMSSTKDRLSQTTQAARERVGHLGETARGQMERVRHQAERMRSGYDSMVRDQPLVLGAIGLAVGAMVAAGLPRTREEDQLMGEASDRLTEKAKEIGQAQTGKVQAVAAAAKDAALGNTEKQDKPKQGAAGTSGRPNVIEPARQTPLGEGIKPKDPRLGTP
jgi:hypothetical protein